MTHVNIGKIYIISCKFGFYLSNVLKYILNQQDYEVEIKEEVDLDSPNLHIILFSQKVSVYPKHYIIYQLEQKDISNWINKKYELSLLFSHRCWDYSEVNIKKFHPLIQQKMDLVHIPILPYTTLYQEETHIEPFDILFYGTMNQPRKHILNYIHRALHHKYKIRIITNTFGKELFKYINASKIVLNIHYYENALLESYRISEVQSCKKLVISFLPNKEDILNFHYYKESIVYVNSVDNMIGSIIYYLENNNKYEEKIKNIKFIEDMSFIHSLL